jgi:hypothetical protein
MNHTKNVPGPARAANDANTLFPSDQTEQAKSESAVPEQRTTKAETNRRNSLKSTGPKTPRGKRDSRCNAVKHGLYSKELFVAEADRPEFEQMRVGLKAQLKPNTTLQWSAYDYVVACQWRCKLALRLEHPQFARQFQEEQPENEQGKAPDVDPVIERWYGFGRADTLAGVRLLDHAIMQFQCSGYFHADTKALLRRAFGVDFVPWLEQWPTMSQEAIMWAEHWEEKMKLFEERGWGGTSDFLRTANTGVKSPSTPGETADAGVKSPSTPGETADTDVESPSTPGETADAGVKSPSTPGETADTDVESPSTPGETADAGVESPSTLGETVKVVIDPKQGRHMVIKLLEEKKHFLKELLIIKARNTLDRNLDAAQSPEFNPRFLADANRELRRALDWYLSLRAKGL